MARRSRCRSSCASPPATSGRSPESGKELSALLDRFLFRKSVRPILSMAGRQRLLWERDHAPKLSTSITPAEIDQAHAAALALPWTDEAKQALETILRELAKEGIQPGDRRQFKAVGGGPGVRLPQRRRARSSPSTSKSWRTSCGTTRRSSPRRRPRSSPRSPIPRACASTSSCSKSSRSWRRRRSQFGPGSNGHGQARRDRQAIRRAQGRRPARPRPQLPARADQEDQAGQHRGHLTERGTRAWMPSRQGGIRRSQDQWSNRTPETLGGVLAANTDAVAGFRADRGAVAPAGGRSAAARTRTGPAYRGRPTQRSG